MEYDEDKVDEMGAGTSVLDLARWLPRLEGTRWDRLRKKGMIANPVGKAKSVVLTEKGLQRSRDLFTKHFAKSA